LAYIFFLKWDKVGFENLHALHVCVSPFQPWNQLNVLHRIWSRYYASREKLIAVIFTFLTLVIEHGGCAKMRQRRQQCHILDPEKRNGKTVAKSTKLQEML